MDREDPELKKSGPPLGISKAVRGLFRPWPPDWEPGRNKPISYNMSMRTGDENEDGG